MTPLVTSIAGKFVFVMGLILFVAIRVPHDRERKLVRINDSRRGLLEAALMVGVGVGCFVLPLLFVFTNALGFADSEFSVVRLVAGSLVLALGLWLFRRAHVDLGANWSPTLELRENHGLVNHGLYRVVRHPMYSSFLVYGVAQALLLANWVAGPSFIVAFVFMFAFRLAPEERMMRERFGQAYDEYAARTKRVIPYVW